MNHRDITKRDKIIAERYARGEKQREIASAFGVSQACVSKACKKFKRKDER